MTGRVYQRPVPKHRRQASDDAAMPFPALPKEMYGGFFLSHHESMLGIKGWKEMGTYSVLVARMLLWSRSWWLL